MAQLGTSLKFRRPFKRAVLSPVVAGPYYPKDAIDSNNIPPGDAWGSPELVKVADVTNRASGSNTLGSASNYLLCTNFGFNIDRNRSIVGIKVETINVISAFLTPLTVRLQKTTAIGPRVLFRRVTTTDDFPTAHDYNFGSALDSWDEPFLPSELNSSEFGCALILEDTTNSFSILVDAIRMTVYTTDNALPVSTYAVGTYNFGPTAVTVGATSFTAYIDATLHTDAGVTVTLEIDISYDAGATWKLLCSGSGVGGAVTGPSGVTEPRWYFRTTLASTADSNTQFKGSLTIAGGSLVTSVGIFMS
jgi:hypothetical protein